MPMQPSGVPSPKICCPIWRHIWWIGQFFVDKSIGNEKCFWWIFSDGKLGRSADRERVDTLNYPAYIFPVTKKNCIVMSPGSRPTGPRPWRGCRASGRRPRRPCWLPPRSCQSGQVTFLKMSQLSNNYTLSLNRKESTDMACITKLFYCSNVC